jgi:hypothetical protein
MCRIPGNFLFRFLASREGTPRVFENGVLGTMFGPESDEVGRHWRRLHNEELHDLDSSPNIVWVIKNNEMGGACRTCWGEQNCILGFKCLARKPKEKRPLGRHV